MKKMKVQENNEEEGGEQEKMEEEKNNIGHDCFFINPIQVFIHKISLSFDVT
jgi:hypothetical protein